jgi:hypothetical protein
MKLKETMLYKTELKSLRKEKLCLKYNKAKYGKGENISITLDCLSLWVFSNTVFFKMLNMTYLGLYIIMGVFIHNTFENGCFHQ